MSNSEKNPKPNPDALVLLGRRTGIDRRLDEGRMGPGRRDDADRRGLHQDIHLKSHDALPKIEAWLADVCNKDWRIATNPRAESDSAVRVHFDCPDDHQRFIDMMEGPGPLAEKG